LAAGVTATASALVVVACIWSRTAISWNFSLARLQFNRPLRTLVMVCAGAIN
jgi:hypothetical protein